MLSTLRRLAAPCGALVLALAAARADEGMWLFTNPPVERLAERYGFEPSAEWLEHLRKSAVRFSTGGSGSIVSSDGLVMTNHHVGSDILERLSTAERDLLETGFLARTKEEELPCPNLELMALWEVHDVTDRVNAAAEGLDAAEAGAARRKAMSAIEKEMSDSTGLHCEMVTLYQGGQYHLYAYKRWTDVRLVMAPELQAAFYGGDIDNFEYPRYCLDACFFRIYEDGAPLQPESYLRWSADGSRADDLVFVAGHPGSTRRINTVAHLEFMRDVRNPAILGWMWRNEVKLKNFSDRSAENARIAHGDYFGVQNGRKAYTGILAGLHDPAIFAAKRAAERELRAAVNANPEWKAKWGDAWDRIAEAERTAASLYERYLASSSNGLRGAGDLYGHAMTLVRMADEVKKPNEERLREFSDASLESVRYQMLSDSPIYPELERFRLASSLSFLAETLGGDDPLVKKALGGKSPMARAAELVAGTSLGRVEARKKMADMSPEELAASGDAMIDLARALDADGRALRKRWEDEVQAVEREGYAKIAAAKFAVEGDSVYPDATFSLRLAFGTVKGWKEGGRDIPPYTKFEGLYEKHAERGDEEPYELRERWIENKGELDLSTPYNFVCTADIIGGNSGSPVVNRAGEVVGLIFDGNIHSLVLDIAYTDEVARAVSVDSRGIVEALESIYGATELVQELQRDVAMR